MDSEQRVEMEGLERRGWMEGGRIRRKIYDDGLYDDDGLQNDQQNDQQNNQQNNQQNDDDHSYNQQLYMVGMRVKERNGGWKQMMIPLLKHRDRIQSERVIDLGQYMLNSDSEYRKQKTIVIYNHDDDVHYVSDVKVDYDENAFEIRVEVNGEMEGM